MERCPYCGGVHSGKMSILCRRPCCGDVRNGGVHIVEVPLVERCPYCGGVHN